MTSWREFLLEIRADEEKLDPPNKIVDKINAFLKANPDTRRPEAVANETPKCCYGWAMKPACIETCPHATEEAKKLLMHRLSYPAADTSRSPRRGFQE